jgi:hypothetical protein
MDWTKGRSVKFLNRSKVLAFDDWIVTGMPFAVDVLTVEMLKDRKAIIV